MEKEEADNLRNRIGHYFRLVQYYDSKENQTMVTRCLEAYNALTEYYDEVIGDGNYATF